MNVTRCEPGAQRAISAGLLYHFFNFFTGHVSRNIHGSGNAAIEPSNATKYLGQ